MTDLETVPMHSVDYLLVRHFETDFATYGRIYNFLGDREIAVTIERPWVDKNRDGRRDPRVSRFEPGTYRLIRARSPKRGYDVWWFCGVPDVSLAGFADPTVTTAQIHIANLPDELEGCVGIGLNFGFIQRQQDTHPLPGVVRSRDAFNRWMNETKDKHEIWMKVINQFPAKQP